MCYSLTCFDFQKATEWCKTWRQLTFNSINLKQLEWITNKISRKGVMHSWSKWWKSKEREKYQDFGITVSYDLSWSDHIYEVVNKLAESLGSLSACLGLKPECNRILFRLITIHISSKTDPGVCCSRVVLFPTQGHSFARKLKSRGERRDWPSAKRGAKWKTRDVVPF